MDNNSFLIAQSKYTIKSIKPKNKSIKKKKLGSLKNDIYPYIYLVFLFLNWN